MIGRGLKVHELADVAAFPGGSALLGLVLAGLERDVFGNVHGGMAGNAPILWRADFLPEEIGPGGASVFVIFGAKAGELVDLLGRSGVDGEDADDVVGEFSSVIADIESAGRVTYENDGTDDGGLIEQGVQLMRDGFGVARAGAWVAPSKS